MTLADLDADLIGGFLQHLEDERGNSASTRNARRAALRSFFTYASYRAPGAIATISQVLAVPAKRTKTTIVSFLTHTEGYALIAAPDTTTWIGRRDRLLLHLAIQTTHTYLHADLALKRGSLDRLTPIGDHPPAHYQASDALIAFLSDR